MVARAGRGARLHGGVSLHRCALPMRFRAAPDPDAYVAHRTSPAVRLGRCWRSAASSTPRGREAWLRGTLEEIVSQVRRLLDVTGVSFLVVDRGAVAHPPGRVVVRLRRRARRVRPRARPPVRARAARGVTEAAIEGGAPVLIERIVDWPGAEGLEERLRDTLDARGRRSGCGTGTARPRSSRCPVRTGDGRILGVLAIAALAPRTRRSTPRSCGRRACSPTSRRSRWSAPSCWTARSAGRATRRRSTAPRRRSGARSTSASCRDDDLRPGGAAQRRVDGAAARAWSPAARSLREVARCGRRRARRPAAPARARRGGPRRADGPSSSSATESPTCRSGSARACSACCRRRPPESGFATAAWTGWRRSRRWPRRALANALDYDRERRVVHAMTAGFVPAAAAAARRPRGRHRLRAGRPAGERRRHLRRVDAPRAAGSALIVGDVTGERAGGRRDRGDGALLHRGAHVRLRAPGRGARPDQRDPARPAARGLFVPTFLAVLEGHELRWCNAGHPPPQLLCAGGGAQRAGHDRPPARHPGRAAYEERSCELAPGRRARRRHRRAVGGAPRRRAVRRRPAAGPARRARPRARPRGAGGVLRDEAERWAPQRQDDLVILAVRARR